MPRVQRLKANKDYPAEGIRKGQTYFKWKLKLGPRHGRVYRSSTYPRAEQLTTSPFLRAWYPLQREIANFGGRGSDLEDLAERVRELGEQEQEKYDNMPYGLQQGPNGGTVQDRAEACETLAQELEQHAGNYPNVQLGEEYQTWLEDAQALDLNL